MTEEVTTRHPHKRLWIGAIAGVLLLACFVALTAYLRSASLEDFVRKKVITALEDATGGRVKMVSFHWNLAQLAFEANDLTIHGVEPPDQLPYAHVDRALVRLRIVSFLRRQVSLRRLELQHPVVHIIVNSDGTTNAPQPKVASASGKNPAQELFDLAIARADLHEGVLVINEHLLPLDFSANDIIAQMSYNPAAHRFDGNLQAGKIDLRYRDFRDLPAQVDAKFSLWYNAVEIKSLRLTSQQSSFQTSGKLVDFYRPQIQLTYSSTIDVAQLGAVTRAPQPRGGALLLNGLGSYSQAAGYASSGHIAFRDLDYLNDGLALRRGNLDSNFKLERDRLTLSRIAAHVLGGEVTGEAEVENLLASAAEQPATGERSSLAARSARQQQGSARLRVSGLSLNELARTFLSRSLPLDKLNAVGSVRGSVDVSWRESFANAVADLALDIAAPSQTAANELPVSGNVRGRYSARAERMELAALELTTPHAHLEASGSLGSTSAALKGNAKTTSLTELQPMMAAIGNAAPPIELAGTASFNGTLGGRLRAPQLVGHVDATDFTYVYTPATAAPAPLAQTPARRKGLQLARQSQPPPSAQAAAPPRRAHIDEFSGDVQYSQTSLVLQHALIKESGAQLKLDGSSALERGSLTDNSEFQVQATLHNANLAELQRAAGLDYPLRGSMSFALQAAGTIGNPHGQGQLSLAQAEVHGYPVKSLTSKISFANHAAQWQDLHLQAAHGTVTGSAGYDFRRHEGNLDLKGQSIALADIPELQTEHLRIAGQVNFTARGSGSLDRPVVNARVEIGNLALNEEMIGIVTADAVTEGRRLTLTARSRFPRATLTLDGTVDLEGDMPANVVLRFANLDVNPFLPPRIRSQVTRQASLDGRAQLSGPLKQPQLLRGSLQVQQFSVEVQHILVRSDGAIDLSFADQAVTVQRCTIVSEDTRFTLTGMAGLRRDRPLDLHANGSLNLKLAETLDPDITAYGVSNINVSIAGNAAQPMMTGRVEIVHAGLSKIDLPVGFGDMSGTLVFNQDRLEVGNLTGRMGGGRVKLGGFVSFGRTLGFNLSADGTDVRFRYSGLSVTSDQTLRLTGSLQNASLTGNVTVTRFAQIPSSDLQLLLSQATAPPSVANPKSPLNNVHLEVRILSTPELTVETSLAKLSGDVDLRLRGSAARPVLLGRINIAEGDIKLSGTKYHLERGDITFVNPVRIDPVLDVEATTRIRDYDITIGLHGTVERLNTTYRSDPPLSTDDIVSLLAFGRTQTENALGAASNPGFSESASGALLSSALNQVVTNRVSKIFGSSTIRINPSLGGPENDPNARLSLQQQVSNNLTFTYITNLARSAQEVIQFEYNINREYTLQGIRDENGVVSFDLLIRKRRR